MRNFQGLIDKKIININISKSRARPVSCIVCLRLKYVTPASDEAILKPTARSAWCDVSGRKLKRRPCAHPIGIPSFWRRQTAKGLTGGARGPRSSVSYSMLNCDEPARLGQNGLSREAREAPGQKKKI